VLALIGRILLGSSISALIHVYLWFRVIRAAQLPRRWHLAATIALVVMFLSIPVTTTCRMYAPELSATLGWIALPWMALAGLTLVWLITIDVIRLIGRIAKRWRRGLAGPASPPALSRRQFITRVTGGAALTVGGASVAGGMLEARGEHQVVDVEVRLPKLPRRLDGFTIVQLSDLHVGMTIDRGFCQRVVDRANHLAPDLIALTGDLVDGRVDDLRDEVAPLAQLRAPHGVFAITGNHEYYSGVDEWIAEITRLGARYLRNQRVTIADGFELAGVDDYSAAGWPGHGEDLAAALGGRDPSRPVVLLAHQPRQVRRAAKHAVDLQLSGHTHGGQIWPWHYIVKLQQGGLLAGRYDYQGTQLYVSRGCGYWGPPVRVLAPLEITRVILRAA
jgi:predicted MPP superfamily phosphohydrolase